MGRKKKFDQNLVLKQITQVFVRYGYEATSMDNLVQATGVLRGSLYAAFGSKLGMFRAALAWEENELSDQLILIAMMELSARDSQIKRMVQTWYQKQNATQVTMKLGQLILARSQILGVDSDEK